MEAFIASFLQYLIIMLILIGVAVLGVVLGIKWRKAKIAKAEAAAESTREDGSNS